MAQTLATLPKIQTGHVSVVTEHCDCVGCRAQHEDRFCTGTNGITVVFVKCPTPCVVLIGTLFHISAHKKSDAVFILTGVVSLHQTGWNFSIDRNNSGHLTRVCKLQAFGRQAQNEEGKLLLFSWGSMPKRLGCFCP